MTWVWVFAAVWLLASVAAIVVFAAMARSGSLEDEYLRGFRDGREFARSDWGRP